MALDTLLVRPKRRERDDGRDHRCRYSGPAESGHKWVCSLSGAHRKMHTVRCYLMQKSNQRTANGNTCFGFFGTNQPLNLFFNKLRSLSLRGERTNSGLPVRSSTSCVRYMPNRYIRVRPATASRSLEDRWKIAAAGG